MRATQLQWVFSVLMEVFDQVVLCTNVGKMVIIVCQPCCAIGYHSTETYVLRMTGEGLPHW